MKKILIQILVSIALMTSLICLSVNFSIPVFAQSSVIRQIGDSTKLPTLDVGHSSQTYQPGASRITSLVWFIIDFLKYTIGAIATIVIIISGIKMVMAGANAQDVLNKEKKSIMYAAVGLLSIIFADQVINATWGVEGETFRSASDLTLAGDNVNQLVAGLTSFLRVLIPSVAVFFIIFSGFRLVTSGGDSEKSKKAKTQITWSVFGLMIAGLAEIIVYRVVFPDQGSRLSDTQELRKLIVNLTNFVSGFITIVSVTLIIYAGYLYVISRGGDKIGEAKKIIVAAVIGMLIAMSAFAFVNTIIRIDDTVNSTGVQLNQIPGNNLN